MNNLMLGFFVFVGIVILVSLAMMWHWKKYMPETGRGAGVFTVYIIGVAILLIALFSSLV
jgi:hypothetical protein